jgi:hypothetical protein
MKKNNILNGGYIGIIMLLLGVFIIIFFIVRSDLFTREKEGVNVLEKSQDYIDSAKDVKGLIEKNNNK